MDSIKIEKYNETWPSKAEEEMILLEKALEHLDIEIEHIGSTSIPNLASRRYEL